MAKVMVSFPDDLLKQIDLEAERQATSRSALLQKAVKREIGLVVSDPDEIVARLEALASKWDGPGDAAAMIRRERERDG